MSRAELKDDDGRRVFVAPAAAEEVAGCCLRFGDVLRKGALLSHQYDVVRGEVSQELREAVGHLEGEEYIWSVRMRQLGLQPVD